MNTVVELQKVGAALIGKSCQSSILTMISGNGRKVLEPAQIISGYEIVPNFGDYELMLVVGGESVYYDTCINFSA
jgi:hypothetical protein